MGHVHRRLIAFDLDGTLVDSRQDLADAANALIVECGGRALSTEAIAGMVGHGAAMLVQRALAAATLPQTEGAVQRFLALYDERLLETTRPYPGIAEVLDLARTLGTVAVLTNKPLAPSERILSALGLRDAITSVIGGDSAHGRKPDPAGLRALMLEAGAQPLSTLLVGDSHVDLETAHRAGARGCFVSYGFGTDAREPGPHEWRAGNAADLLEVLQTFATVTAGASGGR